MPPPLFKRYIWLLETIANSGKISLEEINRKWLRNSMSEGKPIPKRTFHNHRIAIEEMFDLNIECDSRTYEYSIEPSDDLEKDKLRQWMINSLSINNLNADNLKGRIQTEEVPSGNVYLTSIIEAMRDGMILDVEYQSYKSNNVKQFNLEPYFVKLFKQRWYIIGCSDHVRIYALDRIKSLTVTKHSFEMPEDFNPEEFFKDCYGIIHEEKVAPEDIVLKVKPLHAKYLRSLPLHHTQKENECTKDYSIFSCYLKPTYDFRLTILSFGDDVEVLSPIEFRKEIEDIAIKMSGLYSKF